MAFSIALLAQEGDSGGGYLSILLLIVPILLFVILLAVLLLRPTSPQDGPSPGGIGMACPQCAAPLGEGTRFCGSCGAAVGDPGSGRQQDMPLTRGPSPQGETSGSAIASLITGALGLMLFLPLGILAIVFGQRARREIRDSRGAVGGSGLATAGLILGWIATALLAVVVFVVLPVLNYLFWAS